MNWANRLTLSRLALTVLFVAALNSSWEYARTTALLLFLVAGITDFVDGEIARRYGIITNFGELMDPLADRLYILATLIAFTVRSVVTWQFTAALLLRDAMMIVCLLVMRRHNFGPPAVHYIGKTATFILLFAFPVLLLAHALDGRPSTFFFASGWALAWWGIVLYWLAGGFYVFQAVNAIRGRSDSSTGVAAA